MIKDGKIMIKSSSKTHCARFIAFLFFAGVSLTSLTGCGKEKQPLSKETIESHEHGAKEENGGGPAGLPTEAVPDTGENGEGNDPSIPADETTDFYLRFAGDINFDENWPTTEHMDECENGIYDCIDEDLVSLMTGADLMYINNEFTYGTDTEILPDKPYNFRADPSRVENLHKIGVDVVSLANNHVFDYQEGGLLETIRVLDEAGIPHFGAGKNLDEALKPCYMTVKGVKFAFVTSMSDWVDTETREATDEQSGIVRNGASERFLDTIREAKNNADFVIVCAHWGIEYSTDYFSPQVEDAEAYIEAGADAIIGCHPHILQRVDFLDGKPVFYSLGNYWFNDKSLYTTLVEAHFYKNEAGELKADWKMYPALQSGIETDLLTGDEASEFFDYMRALSGDRVVISDDGVVTPGNTDERFSGDYDGDYK